MFRAGLGQLGEFLFQAMNIMVIRGYHFIASYVERTP